MLARGVPPKPRRRTEPARRNIQRVFSAFVLGVLRDSPVSPLLPGESAVPGAKLSSVLAFFLAVLLSGSLVYCVLAVVAAVRYRAVRPAGACARRRPSACSSRWRAWTRAWKRTCAPFSSSDYPDFEILFARAQPAGPGRRRGGEAARALSRRPLAPDRHRRAAVSQRQGLQPGPHAGRPRATTCW